MEFSWWWRVTLPVPSLLLILVDELLWVAGGGGGCFGFLGTVFGNCGERSNLVVSGFPGVRVVAPPTVAAITIGIHPIFIPLIRFGASNILHVVRLHIGYVLGVDVNMNILGIGHSHIGLSVFVIFRVIHFHTHVWY